MNYLFLLTGSYTEEEFLDSIAHLSALRLKYPKFTIDTIIIPIHSKPGIETRINKMFDAFAGDVIHIPLREFIHWDVNKNT